MDFRLEVTFAEGIADPLAQEAAEALSDAGLRPLDGLCRVSLFLVRGGLSRAQMTQAAEKLFHDPITEKFSLDGPVRKPRPGEKTIEIHKKPGVTDPVSQSALRGIRDLGFKVDAVHTGTRYIVKTTAAPQVLRAAAARALANEVIEEIFTGGFPQRIHPDPRPVKFKKVSVRLRGADDDTLRGISADGHLFLDVREMRAIRDHFEKIGREPTDVELETLAQTWSEHCVHKTFKGKIDFDGATVDSLFKTYIMRVTWELNKPWCISVFSDNAGVIDFDGKNAVCFKVETHNHPSAIEPYGGAGTGIGGVIRDPLGTGLGAKPFFNTDVFCFGYPDMQFADVPKGALHPKTVMRGVVAGVRDYGNRMGIPTINGAVCFDNRYTGNPLVFCGNGGLMPRDKCFGSARAGDLILVVGGRTGRDGIHGATFSSGELTHQSETTFGGAVQIGNPIVEKKMADCIIKARDLKLYRAITDCGAGGLSSAIGEMGEKLGAEVRLDKVPLKYAGLTYSEIWISEAQERMVLAVPPKNRERIARIFADEDVDATFIGKFATHKKLKLFVGSERVADLDMDFLHNGVPRFEYKAEFRPPVIREKPLAMPKDLGKSLKRILSAYNVCSKEWIVRQYDHEVQGQTVIKPLQGVRHDGPGDAAVVTPILGSTRGVAVSNGLNPMYGDLDPYRMAASAIDEAIRNIVATGGSLERLALLDNFCWGNTRKPDRLGSLVLACRACYDIAKAYGTPFISGKDSLNNEFNTGRGTVSIPPTLLISAIAVQPDVTKSLTMDFKAVGNAVYVVGLTKKELGGSHYLFVNGRRGGVVPEVDPKLGLKIFRAVSGLSKRRLIRSAHDCSEGGIACAVAEMAFAGEIGAEIDAAKIPVAEKMRADEILFSESNSRFILEIEPRHVKSVERALKSVPYARIGTTTRSERLTVKNGGQKLIDEKLGALKTAWQKPLKW